LSPGVYKTSSTTGYGIKILYLLTGPIVAIGCNVAKPTHLNSLDWIGLAKPGY